MNTSGASVDAPAPGLGQWQRNNAPTEQENTIELLIDQYNQLEEESQRYNRALHRNLEEESERREQLTRHLDHLAERLDLLSQEVERSNQPREQDEQAHRKSTPQALHPPAVENTPVVWEYRAGGPFHPYEHVDDQQLIEATYQLAMRANRRRHGEFLFEVLAGNGATYHVDVIGFFQNRVDLPGWRTVRPIRRRPRTATVPQAPIIPEAQVIPEGTGIEVRNDVS